MSGQQFERELVKERIAVRMNGLCASGKESVCCGRCLWRLKKGFLMLGANLGSRCITAVYSNIGMDPPAGAVSGIISGILDFLRVRMYCSCVPAHYGR